MTALNTAIELAENGFEVFPLKPDGKPYTENEFKNATRDPNLIADAWEKYPSPGAGNTVACISTYNSTAALTQERITFSGG